MGWEALNNPYMLLVARALRRFSLNYKRRMEYCWKSWQDLVRRYHEAKESRKHRALDRLSWCSLSPVKKAMIRWYKFMWSDRMFRHA